MAVSGQVFYAESGGRVRFFLWWSTIVITRKEALEKQHILIKTLLDIISTADHSRKKANWHPDLWYLWFLTIQVESGAFTHFECGDAACFPVRNWRILHTQMKGRCWCSITVNFRGDRFSSVLENQMQIWSTNFGVWPVTSHWLLPGKYNIPWAIRLHRTSPKHDQGSLREDLAVEYSRCYSFLVT